MTTPLSNASRNIFSDRFWTGVYGAHSGAIAGGSGRTTTNAAVVQSALEHGNRSSPLIRGTSQDAGQARLPPSEIKAHKTREQARLQLRREQQQHDELQRKLGEEARYSKTLVQMTNWEEKKFSPFIAVPKARSAQVTARIARYVKRFKNFQQITLDTRSIKPRYWKRYFSELASTPDWRTLQLHVHIENSVDYEKFLFPALMKIRQYFVEQDHSRNLVLTINGKLDCFSLICLQAHLAENPTITELKFDAADIEDVDIGQTEDDLPVNNIDKLTVIGCGIQELAGLVSAFGTHRLTSLHLADITFDQAAFGLSNRLFACCQNLVSLRLEKADCNVHQCVELLGALPRLTQLRQLELIGLRIEDDAMAYLGTYLMQNNHLEKIVIVPVIDGGGAKAAQALTMILQNNQSLTDIRFQCIGCSDEQALVISRCLQSRVTRTVFHVDQDDPHLSAYKAAEQLNTSLMIFCYRLNDPQF